MTGKEVTREDSNAWERLGPAIFHCDMTGPEAVAQIRHDAEQDGQRYKRALMDIGAALLAGRVCDDTAWFSTTETLFDFIQSVLEPEGTEPVDMFGNFPISRDEKRIIAWLRKQGGKYGRGIGESVLQVTADAIERGDHRKEG